MDLVTASELTLRWLDNVVTACGQDDHKQLTLHDFLDCLPNNFGRHLLRDAITKAHQNPYGTAADILGHTCTPKD